MTGFGLLLRSGTLVADPLSGVPVSFDSVEEARGYWEPGMNIVRMFDDRDAEGGIGYVPIDDIEGEQI